MASSATPFSDFVGSQATAPATPFSDFVRESSLPSPEEATAVAGLKAQQAADITSVQAQGMLQAAGQQMLQKAIPPGLQPEEQDPLLDKRPLPPNPNVQSIISGVEQMAEPDLQEKAGGAHKILGGAMGIGAGAIPIAVAAAPVATAVGLGTGALAQTGTEAGLKKAGVPENYANLAGDVAGLVAGGAAGHGASRFTDFLKGESAAPEEVPAQPAETVPPKTPSEASTQTIEAQPEPAAPLPFEEFLKGKESRNVQPQNVPTREVQTATAVETAPEPTPEPEARGTSVPGSPTRVPVPGESTVYPAKYALRDLSDVQPSHSGISFEPNPAFEHQNERNYSKAENAERVVRQAGAFDPSYLLTDNPDAGNGPPIIDARGNVLGGNSRAMTLQRIYESRPESALAYKDLLEAKAPAFGIDREQVRSMQRPVLVREADQIENPQQAITNFNKTGTAALTPSERAVSDSRRVSTDTLDYLASKVAEEGETGTLATAMSGRNGPEIIHRLVDDGLLTPQEKQSYIDERGIVTPEAKQRVSRLMVGRMFDTPSDFENAPVDLRNKLERVVAPLARVQANDQWDLSPHVKDAVSIVTEARQRGIKNLNDLSSQTSMFGGTKHTPEGFAIARKLQESPVKAAKAFQEYAQEADFAKSGGLFETPTPEDAFSHSFGTIQKGSHEPQPVVLNSMLGGFHEPLSKFAKADVVPALKGAASSVSGAADDILKVWAPSVRGESGKKASAILRGNLGEAARSFDVAQAAMKDAHSYFRSKPPQENYDFIDKVERGASQRNGDEQRIAGVLRKMLDERRQQVQDLGKGKLEDYYENYFPHIWKDPDQAKGVFERILGRRPLEGTKSFLKQRTLPTFKAGLDAGLKPVSDNPIDLTLLKVREMDHYILGQRTLAQYKDQGIAKLVRIGEKPPPESVRIDDPIGTVYGPPSETGGMVIQGHYYAPQEAAQPLNNYLGPGLRNNGMYRVLQGANNTLNQAQLGLSAFHLGFTSMEASISKGALGFEQLMRGRPVKAAMSFAEAAPGVISPFRTFFKGNKLLNEWYKPGSQGGEIAAIADELAKAGGRARMDDFYRTNAIKNMTEAWRDGNVIGAALRLPLASLELTAKPIMEYLVPRQKLGVFLDMARFEMDQHNRKIQGLSEAGKQNAIEDLRRNMRQAWDSVDNRMGQMVYDNLFWNRTAKDLSHLLVRSVGWNLGTLREVAGGLGDIAKQPISGLQGKPVNLKRLSYIASLASFPALYGAMYMYLRTGHGPEEPKDYYFPKTGEKDAKGYPQRVSMPNYWKDIVHYGHDPIGTLEGKVSPIVSMAFQMFNNKDFFGRQIRNTDDPLVQQLLQESRFVGQSVLPMGVRNYQRQEKAGEGMVTKAQNFIGITPAPKYIEHPTTPKHRRNRHHY